MANLGSVPSSSLELSQLRAELDGIDDALHDLLMRRAEIVERLASSGVKGQQALRPGREAIIIRRLLARHSGPLPAQVVLRLWRELLAGTTAMQRPLVVAVCETDPDCSNTQCAREHFGVLTPMHVHRTASQAMAEVSTGRAAVAVMPMPTETESLREAWWTALLHKDEGPRFYIIARLPFWAPRPEGVPRVQAFVLATAPSDPSGKDRTLLGLALRADVSRTRLAGAMTSASLNAYATILRRDQGPIARALVEVDGYLTDEDPRLAVLAQLLNRPILLGSYAVPVQGGRS
ncbi:MAG: chorismate mutase [Acetobacteraceae bacterium]|nr:chorismate mutase [Acetobacteraceae bacterium]